MTALDLRSSAGLLALLAVPGVGSAGALRIARTFETSDALVEADPSALDKLLGRSRVLRVQFSHLEAPEPPAGGIRVFSYFDPDFPAGLRDLKSPPAVIWAAGTLPSLPCVAVVGSRKTDDVGLEASRRVAASAVQARFGVVSGLALGIDGAAQEATLAAGGLTWAVLGSGVDEPSPRKHLALAKRILESGGGLIAEVPPGTKTTGTALVARDRMQAALSRVTIVVQCGIPSGTMHTARFTLELHRPLAVLEPPEPLRLESSWAGNTALINPSGCEPRVLGARGALARKIGSRRPVADIVVRNRDDYSAVWERAKSGDSSPPFEAAVLPELDLFDSGRD